MKKPHAIRHVFLQSLSRRSTTGTLVVGGLRFRCGLGRSGLRSLKREGDGATPSGTFKFGRAFYRADRLRRPSTALPIRRLRPNDGWCDTVGDRNYNRHVHHPYPASAEKMWRTDHLYDVVVVIGHNERPRVQGGGSAIFLHVAREDYKPTQGCLSLEHRDLIILISKLGSKSSITTGGRIRGAPAPSRWPRSTIKKARNC